MVHPLLVCGACSLLDPCPWFCRDPLHRKKGASDETKAQTSPPAFADVHPGRGLAREPAECPCGFRQGVAVAPHVLWAKGSAPNAASDTTGNVIYHGGPVMAGNMKAYAIFWEPSGSLVSATYNELLERYFRDIGDSGLYANNQQYTEADGRAPAHAKLAGAFVDTSPYPSTPFLQDSNIRNE